MGQISAWQILLLILIIVVLFGARRLPDVASNLGKSLKIFKREMSDITDSPHQQPSASQPVDPAAPAPARPSEQGPESSTTTVTPPDQSR